MDEFKKEGGTNPNELILSELAKIADEELAEETALAAERLKNRALQVARLTDLRKEHEVAVRIVNGLGDNGFLPDIDDMDRYPGRSANGDVINPKDVAKVRRIEELIKAKYNEKDVAGFLDPKIWANIKCFRRSISALLPDTYLLVRTTSFHERSIYHDPSAVVEEVGSSSAVVRFLNAESRALVSALLNIGDENLNAIGVWTRADGMGSRGGSISTRSFQLISPKKVTEGDLESWAFKRERS